MAQCETTAGVSQRSTAVYMRVKLFLNLRAHGGNGNPVARAPWELTSEGSPPVTIGLVRAIRECHFDKVFSQRTLLRPDLLLGPIDLSSAAAFDFVISVVASMGIGMLCYLWCAEATCGFTTSQAWRAFIHHDSAISSFCRC